MVRVARCRWRSSGTHVLSGLFSNISGALFRRKLTAYISRTLLSMMGLLTGLFHTDSQGSFGVHTCGAPPKSHPSSNPAQPTPRANPPAPPAVVVFGYGEAASGSEEGPQADKRAPSTLLVPALSES